MDERELSVIDGETLLDMNLSPPKFCVKSLLPQGLSILGGAPKVGKSWMVMDLCVRVAKGEPIWNLETAKGTALYLCLEDPYFRVQQRLGCITDEAPANLFFANAAGSLADDLEAQILKFVREHPDTVLVVIDTFQMVRSSSGEPSYGGDYEELQKLKRIADTQRISILLVHHLRKQSDRDPVNKLSGTTGISGAVDAIFVLDKDERKQNGAKLICTG
ncbi:MAG: AAA family ATPase, partial [Oscillospiraceae bacterium]|nr:AAA family ATPase [Oscillospiraceae bacterium]